MPHAILVRKCCYRTPRGVGGDAGSIRSSIIQFRKLLTDTTVSHSPVTQASPSHR